MGVDDEKVKALEGSEVILFEDKSIVIHVADGLKIPEGMEVILLDPKPMKTDVAKGKLNIPEGMADMLLLNI